MRQSRILCGAAGLALMVGFSGCSSSPVEEEVDPFQSRRHAAATSSPPPTATPAPTARIAGPEADTTSGGSKTPPSARPAPQGRTPPTATPRSADEGEIVGEETIYEADSHRARAKKLRDKSKADNHSPPTDGGR